MYNGDNVYGIVLWGHVLHERSSDPTLNNWNDIETTVQRDAVAMNFLLQICSLDMICRDFLPSGSTWKS